VSRIAIGARATLVAATVFRVTRDAAVIATGGAASVAMVVALAIPVDLSAQAATASAPAPARPVVIASKPFGESYLLTEMAAQLLEARGIAAARRPGLGATEVAFAALRSDAIDVYPEYTGTGLIAILSAPPMRDSRSVFDTLQRVFTERWGIRWLPPLGFENTYAIAVRPSTAREHNLRTLSDLARVAPALTAGFTPDFIGRPDGLPGLARAYDLRFAVVRPLGQALKYRALTEDAVDVVDGYSTDGLIARYGLVVLGDDKRFFPPYEASYLVGARLQRENPAAVAALTELSDRIDVQRMRALNARVEVAGDPVASVARDALRDLGLTRAVARVDSLGRGGTARGSVAAFIAERRSELAALTARHLLLVGVSLLAAILVSVPLGLWLEGHRRAAEPVIRMLGVIQTIPGIALLAFAIPFLGVGVVPALIALWLYGLFPIVRNTYTGVRDADPRAVHAAHALGMTRGQILRQVRTPLAAPSIMAGIRTAAVINVGTATLAAFIGAGGLGEPIATGLALADTRLILFGAIPAAILALLVDSGLGYVERRTTPEPLRDAARRRAKAS
jgi:osmoprotectant transport system permease protein